MFCISSVKKRQTYFYKKKKSKKEIPVQIPQNIFLQNIFASRPQKTATKKKRIIEEKAGCIYQNYKRYQNDEIAKISYEQFSFEVENTLHYAYFLEVCRIFKRKNVT